MKRQEAEQSQTVLLEADHTGALFDLEIVDLYTPETALQRDRQLQGLVGEYTLHRPYFMCDACHHGTAPVDERVGLGRGAFSPGLSRVVSRLGIEDAFGEGVDVLAEALGVDVAKEGVRRITEGLGAVAEAEQQAMMADLPATPAIL